MAFLILFSMPSAFADVEMVGVDIFCNPPLLAFTELLPFLEICPLVPKEIHKVAFIPVVYKDEPSGPPFESIRNEASEATLYFLEQSNKSEFIEVTIL